MASYIVLCSPNGGSRQLYVGIDFRNTRSVKSAGAKLAPICLSQQGAPRSVGGACVGGPPVATPCATRMPIATGRQHASGVFGVKLLYAGSDPCARARILLLSVVQGLALLLLLCLRRWGHWQMNTYLACPLSAAQRTTGAHNPPFFPLSPDV